MAIQNGISTGGARIGILMLESRFPRILGDIGNERTWPFPVRYKIVSGASPDRIVRGDAESLLENFIQGAKELVAAGVDGIATSCGFLSIFQERLARAVQKPIAASSLMQVAPVQSLLPPDERVGVLTISASHLTETHLRLAGAPADSPVGAPREDGAFARAILNDEPDFDMEKAREENVSAARELVRAHQGDSRPIGALVLECANMAPYACAIGEATGLPVFSIENFIVWFQNGLAPKDFGAGAAHANEKGQGKFQ